MIFITIIFVLLFITYNWLMYAAVGNLWSISEGYYQLKEKKGGAEWLFTMFLICIAAYLFAVTVFTEHWLFMLGAFGAILTGVATEYMGRVTKTIHYGGSAIMVGATSIGCWVVNGNWWVVAGILLIAAICYGFYFWKKLDNPLYWSEQGAFVMIVLGVVI